MTLPKWHRFAEPTFVARERSRSSTFPYLLSIISLSLPAIIQPVQMCPVAHAISIIFWFLVQTNKGASVSRTFLSFQLPSVIIALALSYSLIFMCFDGRRRGPKLDYSDYQPNSKSSPSRARGNLEGHEGHVGGRLWRPSAKSVAQT